MFEELAKKPGASENEERPRKDEKFWFDRNLNRVKVVPTPKGALFVPANITDARRRLIRQSVVAVMRSYGDRIERKGLFDNGDRHGGLLEIGWDWRPACRESNKDTGEKLRGDIAA